MPGVLDKGTLVGVDHYFRDTSICECIDTQSLLSQYLLNPVVLTMHCCDRWLNPLVFQFYHYDKFLNPGVSKMYRHDKFWVQRCSKFIVTINFWI